MADQFGLSDQVLQQINHVFQNKIKIQKVLIYGSRAKGNYRTGSDIDLTVVAPEMSISELFELENELDDLMLPYKIDLSLLHDLENPDLVEHIQRVGKFFFTRV